MKRFYGLIITGLVLLTVSAPVIASTVTGALYKAAITATNSSYTAQNVSVPLTLSTQGLVDGSYINSNFTNVAMQNAAGDDVTFMPGQDSDPWMFFIPQIGQNSAANYNLYTGGTTAMGGDTAYFPGDGGMTVSDAATLEPGNNFNLEFDGYIDTTAGADKNLAYKDDAFQFYVSGEGSLTAAIIQSGTETETNSSYGSTVIKLYAGFTDIGQTFTFTNTVTIDAINLKLFESGSPTGTFSYDIYATSSGKITGSPIVTGSVDVTTLPSSDDWVELELDDFITLTGGVMYGIWPKYDGGNSSNYVGLSYYSTTSNYSGGTRLYSSTGGATWSTHNSDINFSVIGAYYNNKTVTANGVTSGEYKVNVTADGTNFRIYLDDVQAATTSLSGASVPNNANDWGFVQNGVMPYVEYIKFTNSGTLRGHWYWEYDTTFTDQSGNGNDATPTFRTTTTDADVTAVIKSYGAASQSVFDSGSEDAAPDIVSDDDIPAVFSMFYVDLHAEDLPGIGTAINDYLDNQSIPQEIVWLPFVYLGGAVITMIGYRYTRKLMPSAFAGIIWNVFFGVVIGSGLWGLVPIGVVTLGEMANRKKVSI